MLVINHMMLLLILTKTKITAFSVNTIVDNVDNDDTDTYVEGVVEKHNEIMHF